MKMLESTNFAKTTRNYTTQFLLRIVIVAYPSFLILLSPIPKLITLKVLSMTHLSRDVHIFMQHKIHAICFHLILTLHTETYSYDPWNHQPYQEHT